MNNNGMVDLHCYTKMSTGKGTMSPAELVTYAYMIRIRKPIGATES